MAESRYHTIRSTALEAFYRSCFLAPQRQLVELQPCLPPVCIGRIMLDQFSYPEEELLNSPYSNKYTPIIQW